MRRLSTLMLAMSLAVSGAAMAAPQNQDGPGGPGGPDRGGQPQGHQGQNGGDHGGDHGGGGPGQNRDNRGPGGDQHGNQGGPGNGGHFAPGERLDKGQRGSYVNYRNHHLKAPPRGHQWRKVNNDYVLIAVATGVIASVVAANN